MGIGSSDGQYYEDELSFHLDSVAPGRPRVYITGSTPEDEGTTPPTMPPGGSTEPADALFSDGGTQTPENAPREEIRPTPDYMNPPENLGPRILETLDKALVKSRIISQETVDQSPDLLKGVADSIVDFFAHPGRVAQGLAKADDPAQAINMATGMVLAPAGTVTSRVASLGSGKLSGANFSVAKMQAQEQAHFKNLGYDIDISKLGKQQYADLQKAMARFNNWEISEDAFFGTLKEYQEFTKAGGYTGPNKAVTAADEYKAFLAREDARRGPQQPVTKANTSDDMFEQVPWPFTSSEWKLFTPEEKKKILKDTDTPGKKAFDEKYGYAPKENLEPRDYGHYKMTYNSPLKTIWKGPEGEVVHWNSLGENNVDFYHNTGGYTEMTPSDAVHKMKSYQSEDQTAKALDEIAKILDFWEGKEAAEAAAKGKKIPITEKGEPTWMPEPPKDVQKLSPKEAFKRGVEEVHHRLSLAFNNIRSKYMTAVKEPKMERSDFTLPSIAVEKGYTTPAFRGIKVYDGKSLNPVQNFNYDESALYSSASPMLADMYSSYLNKHPGYLPAEGMFDEGAQVMPLLINTKDYYYYNAKGGHWSSENPKAIRKAREEGRKGVIVDNVWDEPNSTHSLTPKKIFITFPEGASTVKSRFAEKFDESSKNMLHTIGIGGPAGYIAAQEWYAQPQDEKQ